MYYVDYVFWQYGNNKLSLMEEIRDNSLIEMRINIFRIYNSPSYLKLKITRNGAVKYYYVTKSM